MTTSSPEIQQMITDAFKNGGLSYLNWRRGGTEWEITAQVMDAFKQAGIQYYEVNGLEGAIVDSVSLAAALDVPADKILDRLSSLAPQKESEKLSEEDRAALHNWLAKTWQALPDQSKYSDFNHFMAENFAALLKLPPEQVQEKMAAIRTDLPRVSDNSLPEALSPSRRINLARSISGASQGK